MKKSNENYIINKELEKELIYFNKTYISEVNRISDKMKITDKQSRKIAKGVISEKLGEMFLKIANNLINKPNFSGYTYRDEMIGLGVEYMCRFARNYDHTKDKNNGFSYCTMICFNGFLQAIEKENKRSKLKDNLIKQSMQETQMEKWIKEKQENDITKN